MTEDTRNLHAFKGGLGVSDRAAYDAIMAVGIVQDRFPEIILQRRLYQLTVSRVASALRDSYFAAEARLMSDLGVGELISDLEQERLR